MQPSVREIFELTFMAIALLFAAVGCSQQEQASQYWPAVEFHTRTIIPQAPVDTDMNAMTWGDERVAEPLANQDER